MAEIPFVRFPRLPGTDFRKPHEAAEVEVFAIRFVRTFLNPVVHFFALDLAMERGGIVNRFYAFLKRRTIWIFVSFFFAGLLWNVGIELAYAGNKPRTPDVTSGRVNQLTVNHGSRIYVSEKELKVYDLVKELTLGIMLISVAGAGFLKVFGSKSESAQRAEDSP